jgi:hypothetical protein
MYQATRRDDGNRVEFLSIKPQAPFRRLILIVGLYIIHARGEGGAE